MELKRKQEGRMSIEASCAQKGLPEKDEDDEGRVGKPTGSTSNGTGVTPPKSGYSQGEV